MNTHCSKLCDILEPHCGQTEFNIFPLLTHCALDIICETAMGRSINAQEDSDTPYIRAIYEADAIVCQRQRSVERRGEERREERPVLLCSLQVSLAVG